MRTALALLLATVGCRDIDRDMKDHAPAPAQKPVETAPLQRPIDEAPAPTTPKALDQRPRNVQVTPTTDEGHEYARVRTQYEVTSRERLSRLDARIKQLEQSASESAHQTAQELRKDRDELAIRLDQIKEQAKPAWDDFQAKVDDGFQRLEKRLDDAVH